MEEGELLRKIKQGLEDLLKKIPDKNYTSDKADSLQSIFRQYENYISYMPESLGGTLFGVVSEMSDVRLDIKLGASKRSKDKESRYRTGRTKLISDIEHILESITWPTDPV